MEKYQKEAMQAAKEIIVKFIECGRVTPANFSEIFPSVYTVVLKTLSSGAEDAAALRIEGR